MPQLKPPKTSHFFRIIDKLMIPLMLVLGGFKRDSIQETHPWHCYRGFDIDDINVAQTVSVQGEEKTFRKHFLFLFHAPIIGGWKNYCVLATPNNGQPFFIGWIVRTTQGKLVDYGINKLPISNNAVRLLEGPSNYHTQFFAVNSEGLQVPIQKIGRGRLGDAKHSGLRLL